MNYDDWKQSGAEEITSELNEFCDAIEGDNSLSVACSTAECLTGFTFDPDSLATRIDRQELRVSTSIGIEVDVDPGEPWHTHQQLAKALRSIANQLDRQAATEETPPPVQAANWFIDAACIISIVAITYLAGRVW